MNQGLSWDLVFRIVVRGAPYLLRIMTRIDERMDPDRIFACMSAAERAGLTPCVRYSNAEDGISITDFVEAVPFPATQALVRLPGTLRRLHCRATIFQSVQLCQRAQRFHLEVPQGTSFSPRAKSRKSSPGMNTCAPLTRVSIRIWFRATWTPMIAKSHCQGTCQERAVGGTSLCSGGRDDGSAANWSSERITGGLPHHFRIADVSAVNRHKYVSW
jgi:hypothetical protein